MEKIRRMMMDLINAEIFGGEISSADFGVPTNDELKSLYKLSKSHDLVHIVADALIKHNLIANADIKSVYESAIMSAIFRCENINCEFDSIKSALSDAKIKFIPLKGAVIRKFYPEQWLRTSCDIDILVSEDNIDAASDYLIRTLGYKLEEKAYHDYSLFSPGGVHLELHFSIKEADDDLDRVLEQAWDFTVPCADNPYEYVFTNEFLLFHLYAHAAYHFKDGGGCGVRPFIDVKLLKNRIGYDRAKLTDLLSHAKISVFADYFDKLSDVWFGDGERDDVIDETENFIFNGGVYGSIENKTAARQSVKKGKFRNLLSRIWMPYEQLCQIYPRLKGKRILQPFYEIKRWFKLFRKDVRKRSIGELKTNNAMTAEKVASTDKMLKDLGLN